MPVKRLRKAYSGIPKPIWAIGFGVLFINTSSVIVRSLTPLYLKTVLGVPTGHIGFLEGFIEMLSLLIKGFSGVVSDYLRRRKYIILIGYALLTLSRPLIGVAGSFSTIFTARVLDRLGNGIQATPRDALVADLAPKDSKGACFGLRVALGTAGSFFGAFVALLLINMNGSNYQRAFWLAAIPGILAILLIALFVSEPKQNLHPKDKQLRHPIHLRDIPRLGRNFWLLMCVLGIFTLGQYSDTFMVLHAHGNFGLEDGMAPLILLFYNATYSISSYPIGRLSDRINRYHLLAIGFAVLILADWTLAMATSMQMLFLGVLINGIQMGITQSLFMALVADSVPDDLRGTGFGVFYVVTAAAVFAGNWGAGEIAEQFGESNAFIASSIVAAVALGLMFVVIPKEKMKRRSKKLAR